MEYLKRAKKREIGVSAETQEKVSSIIKDVRENGDSALRRYSRLLDGVEREDFRVSEAEFDAALAGAPKSLLADIESAAANIRAFAEAQKGCLLPLPSFSPLPGLTLGHRLVPVSQAGCYVPGGAYPLFSTALMLAIPAKVAGVERIAVCTPPSRGTGVPHPSVLAALRLAGVSEVYALGGAQAIAALAWGTESVPPVDLIAGPGNAFVAEAKRQCYGKVGLDFVAGPSEALVVVDDTSESKIAAADILAQSEHDPLAQGIIVGLTRKSAQEAVCETERRLEALEKKDSKCGKIARASWTDYGEAVFAETWDEAAAYINARAPEHLELQCQKPENFACKLHNYGSLFLGGFSAEVFGDYCSGPNHTLPTLGAARYTGGLWAGTFLKTLSFQRLSPEAASGLAPLASRLASAEGLAAHSEAAEARAF